MQGQSLLPEVEIDSSCQERLDLHKDPHYIFLSNSFVQTLSQYQEQIFGDFQKWELLDPNESAVFLHL